MRAKSKSICISRPCMTDQVEVDLVIQLHSEGNSRRDIGRQHSPINVARRSPKRPRQSFFTKVRNGDWSAAP